MTKGANNPNRVYQLSIDGNERVGFIINADSANGAFAPVNVPIDQWSYVVGTYDRSNLCVYINGVQQALVPKTTSINTNTVNLRIASRVAGTGDTGDATYTFDGSIDEVRVSSCANNAAWIVTEYNNQSAPGSFYLLGDQETVEYLVVSSPVPSHGATGIPVTLDELQFTLTDPEGNLMDYTVTTSPDIGSASATGVTDGTYTVPVSGLTVGTTYTWHIEVSDGTYMTNRTFSFTTIVPSLAVEYVTPTPGDGVTVSTGDVTIKISSSNDLSDATLEWVTDGEGSDNTIEISIDESLWNKWGFRYPATYVFDIADVTGEARVLRRDSLTDPWEVLEEKTAADFFNGIECVRFDSTGHKAYVSVAFNTSNNIQLNFENIATVSYNSIAQYYDNRKAAYTLSNDNWGKEPSARPGVPCSGITDDSCDKYQAAVQACRLYNIPLSIAINSQLSGGSSMWDRMQEELDAGDNSWEPAVHTRTHPCDSSAYNNNGYESEIIGCRDDILANLANMPFGQYVFTFILPCGYEDSSIASTAAGEFILVRDWTGYDHLWSTVYALWNSTFNYYGSGALETKAYDAVFESRSPAGRYYTSDVTNLNSAFDTVYNSGGIFYGMWHSDRYSNSIIHSTDTPVEGVSGSSFMQHLAHVANRNDVWYVANGWLHAYRMVAQNARVSEAVSLPMTIVNAGEDSYAYYNHTGLASGATYSYRVRATDNLGRSTQIPDPPVYRLFTVSTIDTDGDGIPDPPDNCPVLSNPLQEDSYPPQGNGCGDACECEGNFDGDHDQDGTDAFNFKQHFGRSMIHNPCSNTTSCNGDFMCDGDVDGADAFTFKQDFGRSTFNRPCPNCITVPWCQYP